MMLALRSFGGHVVVFAALVVLFTYISQRWQAEHSLILGRCGVVALAVYMAFCMMSHAVAKRRFAAVLGPQMAEVQRLAALPMPGGALRWRVIAETASVYLVSQTTLLSPTIISPQTIPKGPRNGVVLATSEYRLVRIFQDFARFPVVEYQDLGNEQVVRYFDLRFTGDGRNRSWLDLEIHLDSAGQVRGIRFLNRLFPPHHPDF
jgi:hypothetical protein